MKEYKKLRKVTYYTLQYEDHSEFETEKFFLKLEKDKKYGKDLNNLIQWLNDIGKNRGAKKYFFRGEDGAEALPPPAKEMKQLEVKDIRLYCIRLSESVVVLGNGGIKTAQKALDCPNCNPHFRFVNSITNQLNKKIYNKELILKEKYIQNFESAIFEF